EIEPHVGKPEIFAQAAAAISVRATIRPCTDDGAFVGRGIGGVGAIAVAVVGRRRSRRRGAAANLPPVIVEYGTRGHGADARTVNAIGDVMRGAMVIAVAMIGFGGRLKESDQKESRGGSQGTCTEQTIHAVTLWLI